MRLTTDRAEEVMDQHRGGDEVRRVVEFCFSLMIPKFEVSHRLTGVDFTEMVWMSMIHHREFQERKWDPGIAVVGSSTIDTDGMANLRSLEFTLGVRMIGCLEV
jgi:hypothetical protein